jgi:hypothetical protein
MACTKCVKSARSIKLSKAATIKAKRNAAAGKVVKANKKKANAKKASPKKAKPCKC